MGKFITKKYQFCRFLGLYSHIFLTHSDEIWHEGANRGLPPHAKFGKKSLKRIYHFWASLYQKLPISAILGVVSPHFKSDSDEIFGLRVRTWANLPALNLKKNRLRSYTLFGQIYTKNYKFQHFCGVSPHFKSENSEIWCECTEPGQTPRP